jgi:DnaJ-class molecular chaperone
MPPSVKKTCGECHGTGERCYFKGESRFVLSHDECPACCGLGFVELDESEQPNTASEEDGTSNNGGREIA